MRVPPGILDEYQKKRLRNLAFRKSLILKELRSGKQSEAQRKADRGPALPNAVIYSTRCITNNRFVKSHFQIISSHEMASGSTRQKYPWVLQGLSYHGIAALHPRGGSRRHFFALRDGEFAVGAAGQSDELRVFAQGSEDRVDAGFHHFLGAHSFVTLVLEEVALQQVQSFLFL